MLCFSQSTLSHLVCPGVFPVDVVQREQQPRPPVTIKRHVTDSCRHAKVLLID